MPVSCEMATCTTLADCDAQLASYDRRIAFFREMEAAIKRRPPSVDAEMRLWKIRESIESIHEAADRMRAFRATLNGAALGSEPGSSR